MKAAWSIVVCGCLSAAEQSEELAMGSTISSTVSARHSAPGTAEELPPGYVRGDVVSYSYVPIRTWAPQEGLGILPYLFEYNLMEHRDGVPLETYHQENYISAPVSKNL